MNNEEMACIREHIRTIQTKLKAAADETSIAMLEIDMAQDFKEWRDELATKTLDFVVNLDIALSGIHNERQRLLESQLTNLARNN
ncbi:MAG: hypothetical protein ACYTFY_09130 [Planctomycetota bacterium]|jgi:chemotaxis regulatin CheY-phosphate phosphatase CheZ